MPPSARPWAALVFALSMAGCPQDLEVVAAAGEPCERDQDCAQVDVACGEVLACLDGHCQVAGETPGIIRACEDGDPMSSITDGGPFDSGADASEDDGGGADEDAGADPSTMDAGA